MEIRERTRGDHLGEWWRPDAADVKVPGTLITDPSGSIRLELMAPLTDGHPSNRYGCVLGTTVDGVAVTLVELEQIGRNTRVSTKLEAPVELETLTGRVAYLGAHLPTDAARKFRRATVDLTDLLVWAGESGIRDELGPPPVDLTISVRKPSSLQATLSFGLLSLGHGWAVIGDGVRSRGIEKSVGFLVDMAEPLAFEGWMRRVVSPLRHLLTFATGQPNEVESLTFTTYRYDQLHGSDVEAVYPRSSSIQERSPMHAFEFLFDARTLGARFEATLQAWFQLHVRLGPIFDLFFGPRYRPVTFLENHFLNAVAAAEGYHRAVFANEMLPRTEHRERVRSVVASVEPAHRAWLMERLAFSNEPTLHDRLSELHGRAAPVVGDILGSAADYAAPVVKMRNRLAHPGKRQTADLSGRDLLRLTEQTNLLLTACLLLDLDLDAAFASDAIRRTRRYRLLTEVLRG